MAGTGARLLILTAMAAALTAAAGAHIGAPGNNLELNTLELNSVEINPAAPAPPEGLFCPWAVHANLLEVGRRCGVAANPAAQAELERSVSRMEAYARLQSPARAAYMARYRQREIVGDPRLCSAEAVAFYNEMSQIEPARIRQDTDALLAQSPSLDRYDNCP